MAWWTAVNASSGIGWNPISIMMIPLHITGVSLAGPWCLAMIWVDRKYVSDPLRMGSFLVVMNVVCGAAFTYFGGLEVYQDVLGLLK